MHFDPTDEQRRWRDLAREYAEGEIRPRAGALDREQKFPHGTISEMSSLGLIGLTLPEEYEINRQIVARRLLKENEGAGEAKQKMVAQ